MFKCQCQRRKPNPKRAENFHHKLCESWSNSPEKNKLPYMEKIFESRTTSRATTATKQDTISGMTVGVMYTILTIHNIRVYPILYISL